MGKLVLAILLAGAGVLNATATASLPTVVDVQPARGESVTIRVTGGEGILFKATGAGLSLDRSSSRLAELTAPGTLEITGGEGAMELTSTDGGSFVLSIKFEGRRTTRVLEARGDRATIRVLAGNVDIEAPSTRMREIRTP